MPPGFLGLGSNIERERYIVAGLDALAVLFGDLACPRCTTAAIGFSGQPFLNLVVGIDTGSAPGVARQLRHIEIEHGRLPNATATAPPAGHRHPHPRPAGGTVEGGTAVEIWKNALCCVPGGGGGAGGASGGGQDLCRFVAGRSRSAQQIAGSIFQWRGVSSLTQA